MSLSKTHSQPPITHKQSAGAAATAKSPNKDLYKKVAMIALSKFFPNLTPNPKHLKRIAKGGFGQILSYQSQNPNENTVVTKIQIMRDPSKNEIHILNHIKKQPTSHKSHLLELLSYQKLDIGSVLFEAFLFPKLPFDFFTFTSSERPTSYKIQLFIDALCGLEQLHALNIFHCDFKEENILVSEKQGRFRGILCDFGSATLKGDIPSLKQVVGTTIFTPPPMIKSFVNKYVLKKYKKRDELEQSLVQFSEQEIQGAQEEIQRLDDQIGKLESLKEKLSDTPDSLFDEECELYTAALVALKVFINPYQMPHVNDNCELNFLERFSRKLPDTYISLYCSTAFEDSLFQLIKTQIFSPLNSAHQLKTITAFRETIQELAPIF
jgi:hypothetical protein